MRVYLMLIVVTLSVSCSTTTTTVTDRQVISNDETTNIKSEVEKSSIEKREHLSQPISTEAKRTDNINTFYLHVEKQSQSPPSEKLLKKICGIRIDNDKYINFISAENNKVLMYAITDEPMGLASESVYLYTRYFKGHKPGMLFRVSAWKAGVTPDWAYIFDRNQDGRIDYLAFMSGPSPVAPIDHQGELPNTKGTMKYEDYKIILFNQPLAFWHVADDNHDGNTDGFAMRAYDVNTGWSFGWMVIKSTKYDNKLDKCMYYSEHDMNDVHTCKRSLFGNEYVVPDKYKAPSISIYTANQWLSSVNEAARKCGFNAVSFYGEPRPFPKKEPGEGAE